MSLSRDIQEIMRRVNRMDGVSAAVSKGGGHWHVRNDEGHLLCVAPRTPSDHRAVANTVAQLRRAGVDVRGTKFERESRELRLPNRITARQDVLLANLNAVLSDLGFSPSKPHNPSVPYVAAVATKLAHDRGDRTVTLSAMQEAIYAIRKGERSLSKVTLDRLDAAVDYLSRVEPRIVTRGDATSLMGQATPLEVPEPLPTEIEPPDLSVIELTPAARAAGGLVSDLAVRVLLAVVDQRSTREEALELAHEVDQIAAAPIIARSA